MVKKENENSSTRVTLAMVRGDIKRIEEILRMSIAEQKRINEYHEKKMDKNEERIESIELSLGNWKGYLAAGFLLTTIIISILNILLKTVG